MRSGAVMREVRRAKTIRPMRSRAIWRRCARVAGCVAARMQWRAQTHRQRPGAYDVRKRYSHRDDARLI